MSKVRSLRQALSFLRGNMLVLTVNQVLGQFCRSMVFPYASLYILALGGEPAQVGLINSLSPLAGLILFPIAGYITDHVGRVKLVAFAGYFSGAILLLYVLAPSWQAIAWAALLRGFVVLQFPASSAIIADSLSPQNRGTGIAAMNTLAGILAMGSPYLAGALLDAWGVNVGMRVLYGVMMVVYLISATINLRFLKETTAHPAQGFGFSDLPKMFRDVYGGIPTMLRHFPRSLKAMAVVITLSLTANAVAGPFWVVYAKEQIGFSSAQWGLILLIETALRNLVYIPAGVVVDRYGRTWFLLASLLLSLASVPLFVFATTFTHVLLIRCAVALTNAFFTPACSALMADTVPRENRGRVMAAIGRGTVMIGASSGGTGGPGVGFLITIPLMLSSLLGGYLYAQNTAAPWFFVAAVTAISIALSVLYIRDPQEAHM